jgi:carbon storage regulator
MLLLTRKTGESIVINNIITVTITDISPNGVCVAIEAPREIPVDRQEIHIRKLAERAGAQAAVPTARRANKDVTHASLLDALEKV